MSTPSAQTPTTAPQSTVLVPMVLWDQIRAVVPSESTLASELERLEATSREIEDMEGGSVAYQIMDVLAKSDGNLTPHMARHTLVIMYGEMVRNLNATFTITPKEKEHG